MGRAKKETPLGELKLLVCAAEALVAEQSARLVRSVQQSLRVEGYVVSEEVIRDALRCEQAKAAR